jgi:hypothetical protein
MRSPTITRKKEQRRKESYKITGLHVAIIATISVADAPMIGKVNKIITL